MKNRLKNPAYILGIIMAVLMPIVVYFNLSVEDITTWNTLFTLLKDALMNPYLFVTVLVNIYNTTVDYSTPGITDNKGDK